MGSYTFANLQTRISAEISDASNTNVSVAKVKSAIVSAIEFYERERVWFDEHVSVDTVTVASFPGVAVPTDMVYIDKVQCASVTTFTGTTSSGAATITSMSSQTGLAVGQVIKGTGIPASTYIKSIDSATQITMGDIFGASVNATASAAVTITAFTGNPFPLDEISYDEWSDYSYGATGTSQPVMYTYYQDRLLLYPTPNAVYGLTIGYVKRITTLSADGDNNGWTNFAEPLIRSRAKWDIFEHILYMPGLAKPCKLEELETFQKFEQENIMRMTVGRTRAVYL